MRPLAMPAGGGGSPMRGVQAVALGRGTRKQAVGLLASRFPPPITV